MGPSVDSAFFLSPWCACGPHSVQEEDVIGVLDKDEKISRLQPLGDRVLIKVRVSAAGATWKGGVRQAGRHAGRVA